MELGMEIAEEIRTLTKDLISLINAYNENTEGRAAVLGMVAGKCEHAAGIFRELADAVDRGLHRVL